MTVLRVLIVAPDPLARAGVAALLAAEPGVVVAGQTMGAAADVTAAVAAFRPHVAIWDLGWEPETQLELLSQFVDDDALPVAALLPSAALVGEVRAAGARALLSRTVSGAQLAAAAQALAQNLLVLDEAYATPAAVLAPEDALVEPLSPRELEVLRAMAEGLPNKQIARQLAISEHTIKFHVNAILGKLGVQSRTEAVVRATRAGLILL